MKGSCVLSTVPLAVLCHALGSIEPLAPGLLVMTTGIPAAEFSPAAQRAGHSGSMAASGRLERNAWKLRPQAGDRTIEMD